MRVKEQSGITSIVYKSSTAVRLFITLPPRRRGLRRGLCHRRPISEPQKEGCSVFSDHGHHFACYPTRLDSEYWHILCHQRK